MCKQGANIVPLSSHCTHVHGAIYFVLFKYFQQMTFDLYFCLVIQLDIDIVTTTLSGTVQEWGPERTMAIITGHTFML